MRPFLPMMLVVALAGCSGSAPNSPAAGVAHSAPPAAPAAASQVAQLKLDAVDAGELRTRARVALHEQRIYSPAGNNAIEFYVALRAREATPDAAAQGALMELQPYAVIGAEQALARGDLLEAERLRQLVAAIDPKAPSLSRIADAIAEEVRLRAQRELELVATPDTVSTPVDGPAAPAEVASTPATSTASTASADAPLRAPAPAPTAPVRVPSTPTQAATPAASPALASAQPPRRELVPVRNPPPEYPEEKRRAGVTGQVLASITVNPDGTIGNVDVESVGTRQLAFERSVIAALRRWRYQPIGEERNLRMSFAFAP